MYDVRPNLVLGFHGCDRTITHQLVNTPHNNSIKISEELHDWLGHGFYCWETNIERAWQWANQKKERGLITEPSVVGSVINLGYCCDFLDSKFIKMIATYYKLMKARYSKLNKTLPANRNIRSDKHSDLLLRELDCAVIEYMHSEILNSYQAEIEASGYTDIKIFDTVRGVFTEGGPAFEGAGIFEKSHIQIAIRNLNCIKGFFIPREENDFLQWNTNKYTSTSPIIDSGMALI